MTGFEWPDWGQVFVPDISLAESFLRTSMVYLALLVLFRVVLRRQSGSLGLPDIMLVVLVSEVVSQSMTAQSNSVPNGLVGVLGLLFWNYVLDRLAYRWPWLQRRLEPQPLELVKDGKPIRANMEEEGITDDELAAQLRANGIDSVAKVKLATMESEGTISVVPKEERTEPEPELPEAPPEFERAARAFLTAAEALQRAVAWHDDKATEHQTAAKAGRQLLLEHGIRLGRVPRKADRATAGKTRRIEVATA